MKTIVSFFLCLLSLLGGPIWANPNEAIAQFLKTKGLEYASVGIAVVDISSGKQVIAYNAKQALVPASTLKVVTTATLLSVFSASHKLQTRIELAGKVDREGTLQGDLIIRGAGDPSLASRFSLQPTHRFVDEVVAALRRAGIRKVNGRVIGDERLFDLQGVSPSWLWEDLGNYFAAGAYGLNYGDNQYELVLDTSKSNQQPTVKRTEPAIPDLYFTNRLSAESHPFDSAYIYGAPFTNERTLYGAVPHLGAEFRIKGDLPEPSLFAAQQLVAAMERSAIGCVKGATSARILQLKGETIPASDRLILNFASDSFFDLAKVVNQRSNNLYAESLLRLLVPQEPIRFVRNHWQGRGLDTEQLFMKDGCGLSPTNRVTASFLSMLLYKMRDHRDFVATLPKVGEEGTVAGFLKNTPLSGKCRLKSGSIGGVVAYTGYYYGAKTYAVTVIVNNYNGKAAPVRKGIEKLLLELLL